MHFHVCVVDRVFEEVAAQERAAAEDVLGAPGVNFHPASGIDEVAVTQAQANLRRRILRAFVGRGLRERFEAQEILANKHSG